MMTGTESVFSSREGVDISDTAETQVLRSGHLYVKLVREATTNLHTSIIAHLDHVTKDNELACMVFLQIASKCCREVSQAAEGLFVSFIQNTRKGPSAKYKKRSACIVDKGGAEGVLSNNQSDDVVTADKNETVDEALSQEILTSFSQEDHLELSDNEPGMLEEYDDEITKALDIDSTLDYSDSVENDDNRSDTKYENQSDISPLNTHSTTEPPSDPAPKPNFPCETCGLLFQTQRSLRTHVTIKHSDRPATTKDAYVCDICGKSCKNASVMYEHKRWHKMAYQCSTCGKRFAVKYRLKIHERFHTGEKPYVCHVCSEAFRCSTDLNRHIFDKHTTNKPFQCDQCDLGFRYKRQYDKHMLSHSTIKPFQCTICGKGFVTQARCDSHMDQHTGRRDFQCDECNSTFCTKRALKKHKQIVHANENLICEVCSKTFNHPVKLKAHMRGHTGEKRFECPDCGKRFTWQSNFNDHMRIHGRVKPYQCDMCPRQFSSSANMAKHKKTHRYDVIIG